MGGDEQQRPVTLLHLGLALVFAAGTWVLLKRLPTLLEIILLRRSTLSAADRYAVTTIAQANGHVIDEPPPIVTFDTFVARP